MREEPLKVEAFFIFFLSLLRECGGGERGNGLFMYAPLFTTVADPDAIASSSPLFLLD